MYEDSLSEILFFSELSRVYVFGMDQDYDDIVEFYRYYFFFFYNIQVFADCVFDVFDVEEIFKFFRKFFKIVNFGNYIIKRIFEYFSISFMYCRYFQGFGKQYMNLRFVMEERVRFEFFRDCLFRIKSVIIFVYDLENLVQAEYRIYYVIMYNCLMDNFFSKIYCLNVLCEDLRIYVGYWNNIKQCLYNNRWLQFILGRFYLDLEYVRRVLFQLYSDVIYWMEKFIVIGLQVFVYGSMVILI